MSTPSECLMECLAMWLKLQDKVAKKGGATWDSLIAALEAIGEKAVADGIKSESIITITIAHTLQM